MAGTKEERVKTRYKGGKEDSPGHTDGAGEAREKDSKSTARASGKVDGDETAAHPTEAGEADGHMESEEHVGARAEERRSMVNRHSQEIKDMMRHHREAHRAMIGRHEKEAIEMHKRHTTTEEGAAGGSRDA